MKAEPYASVERMIRLPNKHKISNDLKLFQPLKNSTQNEEVELSEPLIAKANELLGQLNQTFEVYENSKHFKFIFPDSMFPPVPENENNRIRYEQKMITEQENTFKNKLSPEQLKQIEETGQFKVKSNIEYITLPYVWKINQTIFWGQKKIKENWNKALASIFGFFWTAHRFMINVIPSQIVAIKSIPYSLFKLFFGKKSIQTMVSVSYDREIFKDFWNKILQEHYQENQSWFNALWKYLYVYYDPAISRPIEDSDKDEYNKKMEKRIRIEEKYNLQARTSDERMSTINRISDTFNQEWAKLRKRTIIDITEEFNITNTSFENRPDSEEDLLLKENKEAQEEEINQKILSKLAERRFSLYLNHFQTELPKSNVPLDVINAIVLILRLFTLISNRYSTLQKEKEKKRSNIEDRIKNQFKIKSLFRPFLDQLVNSEMSPIIKSLEEEMFKNLINDPEITKFLNKSQVQAYQHFLKVKYQYSTLVQAKKVQRPQYHGPTRVFYSNYHLLPPYKVIKHGENSYSLKKISDYQTVDTSKNFWKFRLYWMRLKTWTINSLCYLFMSVWKGPIGVRALWGVEDFNYDMNINSFTGQLFYQSTRTVLGTFKKVLQGINKSRAEFEETPDLGLLGKNVSRIFNYLECYLFRFLFVGIILVLIGFPLLIILASTITVILVVTFWAWMPLVLIVTYLFNILIKQFETAKQEYGFTSRTFPLLRIALRFLLAIGMIIASVLNLILWTPIRSAFWFVVGGVANLFRRALDKIMMFVFANLGRTPSRDTMIAKKISGPGMSKDFYMSINQQDVYILVRANLEIQFMNKLNELITAKINSHGSSLRRVMGKILSPFGAYYNSRDPVSDNYSQLLSNYNRQYQLYMNRYPNNPYNVRFTQQEIDNYFPNTVTIVQHFVDKFEIQSWIFEQHELYQGMYDQLTRSIWMEVFGCGEEIFEPLEKLDARFKLEDQYNDLSDDYFNAKMKKGVGSVMKALEGEVHLSHQHKKVTPFKYNLLSRQLPSENINQVLSLFRSNSRNHVNLSLQDVKTFFVPNLNIKEIVIVEDEARERDIKRQQFLVDL